MLLVLRYVKFSFVFDEITVITVLYNWFWFFLQQGLGEAFSDLAQKSPELQSEFLCNAETQRSLSRHGDALLTALNFFVSSVNTLVNKTMEDTLQTVKRYETAR